MFECRTSSSFRFSLCWSLLLRLFAFFSLSSKTQSTNCFNNILWNVCLIVSVSFVKYSSISSPLYTRTHFKSNIQIELEFNFSYCLFVSIRRREKKVHKKQLLLLQQKNKVDLLVPEFLFFYDTRRKKCDKYEHVFVETYYLH